MPEKILTVEVKGLTEVIAELQALGLNAVQALGAELYKEAEATITEAKQECPVDTGALRSSGHTMLPEIHGSDVTVECGFGGPAVDYAIYVHEDLTKNHPNGKAKYLEDPLTRRASGMTTRIAAGMRAHLR